MSVTVELGNQQSYKKCILTNYPANYHLNVSNACSRELVNGNCKQYITLNKNCPPTLCLFSLPYSFMVVTFV